MVTGTDQAGAGAPPAYRHQSDPSGAVEPSPFAAFKNGPLVYKAISHRSRSDFFAVQSFEVYKKTVRLVREPKHFPQKTIAAKRGTINAFSDKSRRRLGQVSRDADPALNSMFVATYPQCPNDGIQSKKHVDSFLKRFKRKYPEVGYLWVLEFQRRGVPHYHVFFTCGYSKELHGFLAQSWAQIITKDVPEDYQKCLNVHLHPRSFIDWDMGDGQYVCKYLEKQEQKFVPVSFENVGRFWGASRGLVPRPSVIVAREMTAFMGDIAPKSVKQAVRWLSKWHEKHTGGNSYARRSWNSQSIPTGAPVLKQIMRYLMQLDYPDENDGECPF